MEIITTTEGLKGLCHDLAREPFVTVDTEFMREQTFWPVLCLIQIAGRDRQAIVDPLAENDQSQAVFRPSWPTAEWSRFSMLQGRTWKSSG